MCADIPLLELVPQGFPLLLVHFSFKFSAERSRPQGHLPDVLTRSNSPLLGSLSTAHGIALSELQVFTGWNNYLKAPRLHHLIGSILKARLVAVS